MLVVDAAETAVDGSTEEPNLKTGPAKVEGFAANPKMLPLEKVAEVLVLVPALALVPIGTKLLVLVEEVNRRALPVDI